MKARATFGLLAFVLCSSLAAQAQPRILNVPSQYKTIQAAIDAAQNTDIVLVAPGAYAESIDSKGKAITVTSLNGRGTTFLQYGTVSFVSGEGRSAILRGFTIVAWVFDRPGIRCVNSSPTISDNKITRCKTGIAITGGSPLVFGNDISLNSVSEPRSQAAGGGISSSNASPVIRYNVISRNDVSSGTGNNPLPFAAGGGIACGGGSPWIEGNLIADNAAWSRTDAGGGVYLAVTNAVVLRNVILSNQVGIGTAGGGADDRGGGIYATQGSVLIQGNVIAGNRANAGSGFCLQFGGGIYCDSGEIVNNTVYGNILPAGPIWAGGGGLYGAGSVKVFNNIFWANDAPVGKSLGNAVLSAVHHNDIDDGQFVGQNGNIGRDPLFVNAAANDFHLLPGSPCIDAGTGQGTQLPARDIDNEPRVIDGLADTRGIVDIGADEFATLSKPPSLIVRPGAKVPLALGVVASANRPYLLACSFGITGGFPIPSAGRFPLDPDPLFWVSLGQSNSVFTGFAGVLDGGGNGSASITVSPATALVGLTFYVAGITSLPSAAIVILNYLEIDVV